MQAPSALLDIPGLRWILERYKRYDFPQTWRMCAPPSQTIDELGYSFEFDDGWTDLLCVNAFLEEPTLTAAAPEGCACLVMVRASIYAAISIAGSRERSCSVRASLVSSVRGGAVVYSGRRMARPTLSKGEGADLAVRVQHGLPLCGHVQTGDRS